MSKKYFKNQKEMMQALLDDKKIGWDEWSEEEYFFLNKSGTLQYNDETLVAMEEISDDANAMFIYEPPKKKKKILLHRYIYKVGKLYVTSTWTSDHEPPFGLEVVKTETKEIEVDCE